jgi:hypothetical protein
MFSPNHRNSKMKREALARVREVQKEGAKRKQTDSTSTEPSGKERKTQGDTAIEKEVRELRQEIKIVTANPEDYHAFLDWKMFERYMMGSQKSDPITSDSPEVGFLKQFEKAFPGRKAIFICDNAPYHVVFPEDWPKAGASKDVKEIFLRSRGVTLPEKTTVLLLNAELKKYKEEQQVKGICRLKTLLESRGHILLLTPPRYSTWQATELLWAAVKGKVKKQFTEGRTLEMTIDQLNRAFDEYGTAEQCKKLIDHCLKEVREHEKRDEEGHEDSDCDDMEDDSDRDDE